MLAFRLALVSTLLPCAAYAQTFQLQEATEAAVIAEAKANIVSIGQPCPSVLHVWNIFQDGKMQPAFKVSCSNGRDYQLTIIGSKLYVKPWTGNLLGH